MSQVNSSAAYTSGGDGTGPLIVHTPLWVTIVRGFQAFFAFLILILAGLLIHGLALDAVVFGLVCALFTFIIVTYALVSEKAASCQTAYNIWAILSLDLFIAIFWLSSMGANAALRAAFTVSVNASCYNDGSAINSGHCIVSRQENGLQKRYAVASKAGLAEMSAIAGLSALEMLLFIATLVFNGHAFRMYHQEKKGQVADNSTVEMKPQYDPAQQPGAQQYPQYTDQQQYPSQAYPQQQAQPQQQQPYDDTAYAQQQQYPQQQYPQQQYPQQQYAPTTYQAPVQDPSQGYSGGYAQQTPDPFQQHPYSPHGTPAQQQPPYHPPQ